MAITVPIPQFDRSCYFLTGKVVDISSTASALLVPVPEEGLLLGVMCVLSGATGATNPVVRFGVNGVVTTQQITITASGSAEGDCYQSFNIVPISKANGYVKAGQYLKMSVQTATTNAEDLGVTFVIKRASS